MFADEGDAESRRHIEPLGSRSGVQMDIWFLVPRGQLTLSIIVVWSIRNGWSIFWKYIIELYDRPCALRVGYPNIESQSTLIYDRVT